MVAKKIGFAHPEVSGDYFALFASEDGSTFGGAKLDDQASALAAFDESAKLVHVKKEKAPYLLLRSPENIFLRLWYISHVRSLTSFFLLLFSFSSFFRYAINLFMHSCLVSRDPRVVHARYAQACHAVLTEEYPVPEKLAVRLAAAMMGVRFGRHNPQTHVPGFLGGTLVEYVPPRLLKKHKPSKWERLIFAAHLELTREVPRHGPEPGYHRHTAHELRYLEMLAGTRVTDPDAAEDGGAGKRRVDPATGFPLAPFEPGVPYYAARCWPVKSPPKLSAGGALGGRRLPARVLVGVCADGLRVFRVKDKQLLREFKLGEIYRWGFHPNRSFYFELKEHARHVILRVCGAFFSRLETPPPRLLFTAIYMAWIFIPAYCFCNYAMQAGRPGGAGGGGGAGGAAPTYDFPTPDGARISDHLTEYALLLLREIGICESEEKRQDASQRQRDRENIAATLVQAAFRRHVARARGAALAASGGADARGNVAGAAATLLQSRWRGVQNRRELELEYASVRVQTLWRGYVARCRIDGLIDGLEEALLAEERADAATRVQAVVRGHLAREKILDLLEAEEAAFLAAGGEPDGEGGDGGKRGTIQVSDFAIERGHGEVEKQSVSMPLEVLGNRGEEDGDA